MGVPSRNENYQKQMDTTLDKLSSSGQRPRLLLHSCCGPCSSYVLEYLSHYFDITVFFCNPNIAPQEEYAHRLAEQARLIAEMPLSYVVELHDAPYDHAAYLAAVHGTEDAPEGGVRCTVCFKLRLEETAKAAQAGGYDYFTTTLSVSPHKNAALLCEIGQALALTYQVPYLVSDFKKREGYKRSVALAKEYDLYRQEYCGCEFSNTNAL